MTPQVFLETVEKYYGKYATEFKRNIVAGYVQKIPAAERNVILAILIESVSDQYKSIPDVAAISKVRQENAEEIARKAGGVWRDMVTGKCWIGETYLGYYDGHTFIPNTMLQDREKLGYIAQPISADAYAEWLKENKLLPGADRLQIEASA